MRRPEELGRRVAQVIRRRRHRDATGQERAGGCRTSWILAVGSGLRAGLRHVAPNCYGAAARHPARATATNAARFRAARGAGRTGDHGIGKWDRPELPLRLGRPRSFPPAARRADGRWWSTPEEVDAVDGQAACLGLTQAGTGPKVEGDEEPRGSCCAERCRRPRRREARSA